MFYIKKVLMILFLCLSANASAIDMPQSYWNSLVTGANKSVQGLQKVAVQSPAARRACGYRPAVVLVGRVRYIQYSGQFFLYNLYGQRTALDVRYIQRIIGCL